MGREVSVAPGEYKFAAYLVEPLRGSCRDAGSKSRRPRTNVTLGRWATLRRCSAFWLRSPRLSLATYLLAHGLGVARGITSSFRCGRVDRAGSIPSRHSPAVKVFRTIERELPSIAVVMRRHV